MGTDADSARAEAKDETPEGERRPGVGARIGGAVRELVIVLAMALTLSFVVKTWVAQAFFIPSGSMEQTLQVGDRVMVSKLHKRLDGINRGDVVVFRDPGGWLPPMDRPEPSELVGSVQRVLTFVGLLPDPADEHLIKRVIGVGGDHVVCCDAQRRLTVNDVPLVEGYLKPNDLPSSMNFDITVPAGRVWVMGDHRSDSEDSRFHDPSGSGRDGSVPISAITGRAVATVWPFGRAGWLPAHSETFSEVPERQAAP